VALMMPLFCWKIGITLLHAAAPTIYPAPEGEELSPDYTVKVEGRLVPVYVCKVAPADRERRWKAMDDKTNSASYFETAAFAYFDAEGPVQVEVTAVEPINSAVVPSTRLAWPMSTDSRQRRRFWLWRCSPGVQVRSPVKP
jgi:hypothetical protein